MIAEQLDLKKPLIFEIPNIVKDRIPQEIHGMILAGVNERLRCYEYLPGHRFAPHSDGAFIRNEDERSWYT